MLNSENKHLIAAYAIAVAIVGGLVVVIMNFNNWFFPDQPSELAQFTPASRGIISENDLNFSVFNEEKFRSLGPLVTPEELKRLEEEEAPKPEPGEETVTGTVKPSPTVRREVRHGNPFIPF